MRIEPIIILLIIFSASGCDALYRILDKEGAEEKEIIGQATAIEGNPTVEEVQRLLNLYGYNPGPPDGILGLRTRETIARFQRENGTAVSRFIDNETWALLNKHRANGLVIEYGLNIKLIQKILGKAGFDPGKIDGSLGERSVGAVKSFQKAQGLKNDGRIGYKTLNKLAGYLLLEQIK